MIPALSQNSRYLIDVLRAVLEGTKAPLPYEGVDLGELFKAADVLVSTFWHPTKRPT